MSNTGAKLVRAKVKAPEYLPNWAKCCAESVNQVCGCSSVLEADVNTLLSAPAGLAKCLGCGAEIPALRIIRLSCGCWFPLDLLDLDEGVEP